MPTDTSPAPLRAYKNCADCAHREVWFPDPTDPYHSTCVCPEVLALAAPGLHGVRCSESRAFSVVCGEEARFFKPKGV